MKRREIRRYHGAVVGAYHLHLYCQHPDAGKYVCTFYPGEYINETRAATLRDARAGGWWVGPADFAGDYAVLCPGHANAVPR